jgi:hypothetical protein
MCHGSIDPKFLMRDAEDRYRATAVAPTPQPSRELPPELMGGVRGVWARLVAPFIRAKPIHPAE